MVVAIILFLVPAIRMKMLRHKSHKVLGFILCLSMFTLFLSACAEKTDYQATYTAFWENLPTDTPFPTDTPTPLPTNTHTPSPSPSATASHTATQEPTETLTPTWQPNPYLTWPKADFSQHDVWWGGDAWCPSRGENVSCEIEYRQYSNGCFVGMTCFDACGKYYGVDTIKYGIGSYTFSLPCNDD